VHILDTMPYILHRKSLAQTLPDLYARGMEICWTPRFKQKFDRYVGLRDFVVKRLGSLINRYRENPEHWSFDLERLKDDSLKPWAVFKIALTSGDRLIFVLHSNKLVLVDIGDHDVMQDYAHLSSQIRNSDFDRRLPIPNNFLAEINEAAKGSSVKTKPNNLNIGGIRISEQSAEGDSRWLYEEELDERWVTFLDDEQVRISEELTRLLSDQDMDFQVFLLMGGPGTGKTMILQNIAEKLYRMGRAVTLQMSEPVRKYLESGGAKLPGLNLEVTEGTILLIDDPETSRHLISDLRRGKSRGVRAVVIATDPLQWLEKQSLEDFEKIQDSYKTSTFTLWTCYRQTLNVGKAAIDFTQEIINLQLARQNTKFDKVDKDLEKYLDLSGGMEYVDDGGSFNLIRNVQEKHMEEILGNFRARYDRWKHFSPICIVYDDQIPRQIRNQVKQFSDGLNRSEVTLNQVSRIRGQEFQEMIVFLNESTWNRIHLSDQGSKSGTLEIALQLHIALSRPKDRLYVIIC